VSRSVVLSKLINIQPFPFLEYGKKKKKKKKKTIKKTAGTTTK
jgi:hypothetical protein